MRARALFAAGITAALVSLPAAPHLGAVAAGQTTCKFEHVATLTPGIGAQPGSGTFVVTGEGDTCDGPVNGNPQTGKATHNEQGRYGVRHPSSRASGITGDSDGTGVFDITIPTSAGDYHITDPFTFTFGGTPPTHGGLVHGDFKSDHFSGYFEFTPMQGDCVSQPVTKVHVTGEGVIR